jgi:hypothetical protein
LDRKKHRITDYIVNNQGCNKEEVIRALNVDELSSRMTTRKHLGELIENGVIKMSKSKGNSRDWKLFVDECNPVTLVPRELDNFEKVYFKLYEKAQTKYNQLNPIGVLKMKRSHKLSAGSIDLMLYPLHLFHDIVNIYNTHSIILWPRKISDKAALKTLYFEVFSKISEMHFKISEILGSLRPHMKEYNKVLLNAIFHDKLLIDQYKDYTNKMVKYYDVFMKFGLKDEIEPIFDFLWQISSPYRGDLYFDIRIKELGYKFEDGWKKLLELTRLHPI